MLGYRLGSSADNIETPLEQLFQFRLHNASGTMAFVAKEISMRRIKPSPIGNKINFSNANELGALKKWLDLSVDDLRPCNKGRQLDCNRQQGSQTRKGK
jgi:hypothetical protein